MKVTYSSKAKHWGEGFALLQEATRRLDVIVGPSAEVRAAWDREEPLDQRSVYTLRLSDDSGEVTATFAPRRSTRLPWCATE